MLDLVSLVYYFLVYVYQNILPYVILLGGLLFALLTLPLLSKEDKEKIRRETVRFILSLSTCIIIVFLLVVLFLYYLLNQVPSIKIEERLSTAGVLNKTYETIIEVNSFVPIETITCEFPPDFNLSSIPQPFMQNKDEKRLILIWYKTQKVLIKGTGYVPIEIQYNLSQNSEDDNQEILLAITSAEYHHNARVIIHLQCITDCNPDLSGLQNAFTKTYAYQNEIWIYHDVDIPKGTSIFKYKYTSKERKNVSADLMFRDNIARCYSDPITDVLQDTAIFR